MQTNGLLLLITILNYIPCCGGASSVAPATSTTDPPTTTGTLFTVVPTESNNDKGVEFTDPQVYGPVAGGAVLLLLGGAIVVGVIMKKGLLSGTSAAMGGMASKTGTAPRSTALVERTKTAKVSRTKVKPMKVNVQNLDGRKPSFSIIRVQTTMLSFHSVAESKV